MFVEETYTVPEAPSQYMKFKQGDNRFRILSEKLVKGYEYWNSNNKPVRVREFPNEKPSDIRPPKGREKEHWTNWVKHFWAMTVWDYKDGAVKVLEITQAGIQSSLLQTFKDGDWGHPNGYDIIVTRVGEGLETKYSTMPKPHREITDEIKQKHAETTVNLDALFEGESPFGGNLKAVEYQDAVVDEDKINIEDLPF